MGVSLIKRTEYLPKMVAVNRGAWTKKNGHLC